MRRTAAAIAGRSPAFFAAALFSIPASNADTERKIRALPATRQSPVICLGAENRGDIGRETLAPPQARIRP
jgi:hypothetical protein